MNSKNCVVMTTIRYPTDTVTKYVNMGYNIVVVGDKKTPQDWSAKGSTYLGPQAQERLFKSFSDALPWNHYSRKNIGYVHAIKNHFEAIIDTDDDNFPYDDYSWPSSNGDYLLAYSETGYINPYHFYSDMNIWPRGFPLNYINKRDEKFLLENNIEIGLWQGLADEDPDVDAIYRMTCGDVCFFKKKQPIVLGKGMYSPFNSQNTWIRKEVYPVLYLPSTVSFRFTDILRSIVAQPIIWNCGYKIGFCKASVFQKRNPHDYMKDFNLEIPMFTHVEAALDIAKKCCNFGGNIIANLKNIYRGLVSDKIVDKEELNILNLWLDLINK